MSPEVERLNRSEVPPPSQQLRAEEEQKCHFAYCRIHSRACCNLVSSNNEPEPPSDRIWTCLLRMAHLSGKQKAFIQCRIKLTEDFHMSAFLKSQCLYIINITKYSRIYVSLHTVQ